MAARLRRLSSLSEVKITDKWKEKPTESWFASADGSKDLAKECANVQRCSKMFKGVKASKDFKGDFMSCLPFDAFCTFTCQRFSIFPHEYACIFLGGIRCGWIQEPDGTWGERYSPANLETLSPHLDLKNAQHDGSCKPNIQHCARHLVRFGVSYWAASDNATDTADKKRSGSWDIGISIKKIIHPQHPHICHARFDRFAHGKKKHPRWRWFPEIPTST